MRQFQELIIIKSESPARWSARKYGIVIDQPQPGRIVYEQEATDIM